MGVRATLRRNPIPAWLGKPPGVRQNQKGRVAPVPRLQTWLGTMLGRSAARRPKPALPAIVATLEPVSAARFQMALASAARRITEAGAGHPSVPILLASSSDELLQLLQARYTSAQSRTDN